jgi:hypothetical protein
MRSDGKSRRWNNKIVISDALNFCIVSKGVNIKNNVCQEHCDALLVISRLGELYLCHLVYNDEIVQISNP